MFCKRSALALAAVCFVSHETASRLWAQVTVQQPQVQVFGIDTTVSVPDRGSISLGGVNQGAVGRQVYGPLWWGSSFGQSYSGTHASAHVWIHDLEAMDRAILAEARAQDAQAARQRQLSAAVGKTPPRPATPAEAAIQAQTARAREQLLKRHLNARR